jgi:hypothetical protein
MLQRPVVYVQLHEGCFAARRAGDSRATRRDCPGLSHPRTLAADFDQIKETLSLLFKELLPRTRIRRPHALLHFVPRVEGGYTTVELRGFKQAAAAVGVSFC